MPGDREAYDELCAYTLTRQDPRFIHQHVLDAFTAQHASATSEPVGLTFALAGLYLHVERSFTGREVQRAHTKMAQRKREWPQWTLPSHRGAITVAQVLASPEGPDRDHSIDAWCETVWTAFAPANREPLIQLLAEYHLP